MEISRSLVCSVALAFASAVCGTSRGEVTIIGALSNFDCPNNTNEQCDEFEIEFEGPEPEDVLHTYCNYNYGCPTITRTPNGPGAIITYKRTGHFTNIGAIEHYGVVLRNWSLVTTQWFRWKHNGVVVTSGHGAPPTPIPPPPTVVPLPDGTFEVAEPVENPMPEESMWIRRSVLRIVGEVNLEQLMWDDPVIQATTPIEVDLERLGPGEVIEALEPIDPEDYIQTLIIVIETHADIATWNPGTQQFDHAVGVLLSRSMNATIVQNQPCTDLPAVDLDPVDTTAEMKQFAEFTVAASAPPTGGQVNYQWRHEGVDLVGEDQPLLTIDPVTPADAGAYYCVISDDCGSVSSGVAYLTVVAPPICYGDADESGEVNFSDVTEVLSHFGNTYGLGTGAGDANRDGLVNFGDVTNVLANFGAICP